MLRSLMLSRVGGFPPSSSTDAALGVGLVGVSECPAEPGEFAGDGDRDDRAALAAVLGQAAPDSVQPLLRLPADRDDVGGLPVLAALEGDAAGGAKDSTQTVHPATAQAPTPPERGFS